MDINIVWNPFMKLVFIQQRIVWHFAFHQAQPLRHQPHCLLKGENRKNFVTKSNDVLIEVSCSMQSMSYFVTINNVTCITKHG